MSKTKTAATIILAPSAEISVTLPDRNVLASTLKAAITVEDGKLVIGEEPYYASADTAGLPRTVVDGVHGHDIVYAAASVKALGEHAFDMFQVDGDMTDVEGSADLGSLGNEVTASVHKSKTNRNPTTGEPVITFGATTVKLTSSAKELKKSREELKVAAAALWGTAE
jgi:hypothetical protein